MCDTLIVLALITHNRAHKIALLIKGRFKHVEGSEIRKAILRMDDELLTTPAVLTLIEICPTQAEIDILNDYVKAGNSPSTLPLVDKFLYEVRSLPDATCCAYVE